MDDLPEPDAPGPNDGRPTRTTTSDCDFGRQLAWFRVRAALRQFDLATRSGLSVRTISDLERGVSAAPRRSSLVALERALRLGKDDRDRLRGVAACARFRGRLRDLG